MTLVDLPEVPALDHFGLYAHLGLVRVMEPETEVLMRERAQRAIEVSDYGPHERPWHCSYHASEFPGDQQSACKRYLLYRMMDLPPAEPMPPWVTTTGTVGKAGEIDIAEAHFEGGRLLSVPESHPDAKHQLGFEDRETWMTASTDLPILPKGWRRPFIVEIKGKADEVLEEMLNGYRDPQTQQLKMRGPDRAHTNQLLATLGLAHEFDWGWVTVCSQCWFIVWSELYEKLGLPGGQHPRSDSMGYCPRCKDYGDASRDSHFELEPPTSGEIYYWSRSWPRKTKSFYYEYDPLYLNRGRALLAETREHFLADELPDRPPHFQWSVGPCASCRFKAGACRPDAGVPGNKRKPVPELIRRTLSTSHGIEHAQQLQPGYSYEASRARVLKSWQQDG